MSAPSASSSNITTARFNVGGTIYEVSKSLLSQHPDTMLARMVSDTWQPPEDGAAVFVERNGERFQYVLDYMRDGGSVALPYHIPKDALLQDLTYYGFEDVDPAEITTETSTRVFKTCFDHIDSMIKEFDSLRQEHEAKRKLYDLAMLCLRQFQASGSMTSRVDSKAQLYSAAYGIMGSDETKNFNAILEKVGWEIESIYRHELPPYVEITLKNL